MGGTVALLVYGFCVRGLGLNHGLKSPYAVVAAVLLILSRRLVRGVDDERPRTTLLVAAFLIGGAVAGAAALVTDPPASLRRFSTHRMPGFRIDLPSGAEKPGASTYSSGVLTVDVERDRGIAVGWQVGDGSREELDAIAAAAKTSVPGAVTTSRVIKIADRDTVAMAVDGGTLFLTIVPCDGRVIDIQSLRLSQSMHERVVRSVVCTPEPHALDEVPIVIDAPGLPRVQNQDGLVMYVMEHKAMIFAAALPFVAGAPEIRRVAPTMLAHQGFDDVQLDGDGDTLSVRASVQGVPGSGTLRMVPCGSRSVMVISFVIDESVAPVVSAAVLAAHCK